MEHADKSPQPPAVQSVRRDKRSAVELVTGEIRRSILRGSLAPGTSFSVTGVAEQLGVSHIPVREALRRLEAQGLVVLSPARSAVVAPLEVADFDAIYRLRIQLEPPLAGRSTPLQDEASLRELYRLWNRGFDAAADPDEEWQNHAAFHLALVKPAASPWDLRFLSQLWDTAERYQRLVFDYDIVTPDEQARRSRIHRELLDACLAGDPDAVEAAVRDHLMKNQSAIRDRLVEAADRAVQPPVS
jgi:DNA-binding GntR family transcriptional regulator